MIAGKFGDIGELFFEIDLMTADGVLKDLLEKCLQTLFCGLAWECEVRSRSVFMVLGGVRSYSNLDVRLR